MKKAICLSLLAAGLATALPVAAGAQNQPLTLDAPAGDTATPAEKPAWMQYQSPYANSTHELASPHRAAEEILSWSRHSITAALTLEPDTVGAQLTEIKKMFSANGWAQYGGYMRESRLYDMVKDKQYSVSTITDGDLVITDRGAENGTYRWNVRGVVLISFHATKPDGSKTPVTGGRFQIDIQVGRTDAGKGREGLLVEAWRIGTTPLSP